MCVRRWRIEHGFAHISRHERDNAIGPRWLRNSARKEGKPDQHVRKNHRRPSRRRTAASRGSGRPALVRTRERHQWRLEEAIRRSRTELSRLREVAQRPELRSRKQPSRFDDMPPRQYLVEAWPQDPLGFGQRTNRRRCGSERNVVATLSQAMGRGVESTGGGVTIPQRTEEQRRFPSTLHESNQQKPSLLP